MVGTAVTRAMIVESGIWTIPRFSVRLADVTSGPRAGAMPRHPRLSRHPPVEVSHARSISAFPSDCGVRLSQPTHRAAIAALLLILASSLPASVADAFDFEAATTGPRFAALDGPLRGVEDGAPGIAVPRDLSLQFTASPYAMTSTPLGDDAVILAQIVTSDLQSASTTKDEVALGPAKPPSYGSIFLKGWLPLTVVELGLLGVTATLPKNWTGWSATFVQDGMKNFGRAYTEPPVLDDDWWFHNYVGHPYGGSVYYNTVRCQGATPRQSFFFSLVLSTQWEYVFEAVAERPSIQDLIITPITGSVLGELTHRFTMHLKKGGTSAGEKVLIAITNPMHAIFAGF